MKKRTFSEELILLLAQGLGTGRIPFAPGTWGSVLGLGWFALLLLPQNIWIFLLGQIGSFILSIWVCGKAEKILGQSDPGSVVLDEIVAIPLCFTLPILLSGNNLLGINHFFGAHTWWLGILGFALFRLFDIWKPWPIYQSQRLSGGLGVTIDDLLAGVWSSCVLSVIIYLL